jgi:hypothetical protein
LALLKQHQGLVESIDWDWERPVRDKVEENESFRVVVEVQLHCIRAGFLRKAGLHFVQVDKAMLCSGSALMVHIWSENKDKIPEKLEYRPGNGTVHLCGCALYDSGDVKILPHMTLYHPDVSTRRCILFVYYTEVKLAVKLLLAERAFLRKSCDEMRDSLQLLRPARDSASSKLLQTKRRMRDAAAVMKAMDYRDLRQLRAEHAAQEEEVAIVLRALAVIKGFEPNAQIGIQILIQEGAHDGFRRPYFSFDRDPAKEENGQKQSLADPCLFFLHPRILAWLEARFMHHPFFDPEYFTAKRQRAPLTLCTWLRCAYAYGRIAHEAISLYDELARLEAGICTCTPGMQACQRRQAQCRDRLVAVHPVATKQDEPQTRCVDFSQLPMCSRLSVFCYVGICGVPSTSFYLIFHLLGGTCDDYLAGMSEHFSSYGRRLKDCENHKDVLDKHHSEIKSAAHMMEKEVGEEEMKQWLLMDRKSRTSHSGDIDVFNANDIIGEALSKVGALAPKLLSPTPRGRGRVPSPTKQQHSGHHAHHLKRSNTRHHANGRHHIKRVHTKSKMTTHSSTSSVASAVDDEKAAREAAVLVAPRVFVIPPGLKLVAEGLCILLNIEPDISPHATIPGKDVLNYWSPFLRELADSEFDAGYYMAKIIRIKAESIPAPQFDRLHEGILRNPKFSMRECQPSVSMFGARACVWIQAVYRLRATLDTQHRGAAVLKLAESVQESIVSSCHKDAHQSLVKAERLLKGQLEVILRREEENRQREAEEAKRAAEAEERERRECEEQLVREQNERDKMAVEEKAQRRQEEIRRKELAILKTQPEFWSDFENVKSELTEFIRDQRLPRDTMPTQVQMKGSARSDLANAIAKYHGGIVNVAKKTNRKVEGMTGSSAGSESKEEEKK